MTMEKYHYVKNASPQCFNKRTESDIISLLKVEVVIKTNTRLSKISVCIRGRRKERTQKVKEVLFPQATGQSEEFIAAG